MGKTLFARTASLSSKSGPLRSFALSSDPNIFAKTAAPGLRSCSRFLSFTFQPLDDRRYVFWQPGFWESLSQSRMTLRSNKSNFEARRLGWVAQVLQQETMKCDYVGLTQWKNHPAPPVKRSTLFSLPALRYIDLFLTTCSTSEPSVTCPPPPKIMAHN